MGRPKKNEVILYQELPVVNKGVKVEAVNELEVVKMELEQLQRRHDNLYAAFRALNKTKNELLDILMGVPKTPPSETGNVVLEAS